MYVCAVIGELDRLAARAAPALAAGRAFGPARRQQLKLLEPPQQFRCEQRTHSMNLLPSPSDGEGPGVRPRTNPATNPLPPLLPRRRGGRFLFHRHSLADYAFTSAAASLGTSLST